MITLVYQSDQLVKQWRIRLLRYVISHQSKVAHIVDSDALVEATKRFLSTHVVTAASGNSATYAPLSDGGILQADMKPLVLDFQTVHVTFDQQNWDMDCIKIRIGDQTERITSAIKIFGHYARLLKTSEKETEHAEFNRRVAEASRRS